MITTESTYTEGIRIAPKVKMEGKLPDAGETVNIALFARGGRGNVLHTLKPGPSN